MSGCHLIAGDAKNGPPTLDAHQFVTDQFMSKMYKAFRLGNCTDLSKVATCSVFNEIGIGNKREFVEHTIDPLTLKGSDGPSFIYNPFHRLFWTPLVELYASSGGKEKLGLGVIVDIRTTLRRHFSNSIPTAEIIEAILDVANGRTIVHLESGTGRVIGGGGFCSLSISLSLSLSMY